MKGPVIQMARPVSQVVSDYVLPKNVTEGECMSPDHRTELDHALLIPTLAARLVRSSR